MNKNTINYDFLGALTKHIATIHLLTKDIKNFYLQDQLNTSSESILTNYTKSNVIKSQKQAIRHLFNAYGSSRETIAWLSLFTKIKLLNKDDTRDLIEFFSNLNHEFLDEINQLIKENNIIWSVNPNAKITYCNTNNLNIMADLEKMTLKTNNLLSNSNCSVSIKNKIMKDACSILLNIEEGLAFRYYYEPLYINFLNNAFVMSHSHLSNLLLLKEIVLQDKTISLNEEILNSLIQDYTTTIKRLCALINKTQEHYDIAYKRLCDYKSKLKTK